MHSTELHHSSPEDAIEVAVTFWRELISDFNLEISRNASIKHTHEAITTMIMITDKHSTILLQHLLFVYVTLAVSTGLSFSGVFVIMVAVS